MTVGGTRNKTNSSVKIVKVENVILMRSSTNCSATGCSGYILKISGHGESFLEMQCEEEAWTISDSPIKKDHSVEVDTAMNKKPLL